jgi:hypothetical protein
MWKNAEKFYHIAHATPTMPLDDNAAFLPKKKTSVTASIRGYLFHFSLPHSGTVVLSVHTVSGRNIFTLHKFCQKAGGQSLFWNGRTSTGRLLPSGYYVYRLSSGMYDENGIVVAGLRLKAE